MKYFYVLLTLSFVFPGLSHAQDLAENNIGNTPSTRVVSATGSGAGSASRAVAPSNTGSVNPQWEKEQDQVNGHISSAKLSGMKKVTESIIAFFHDGCLSGQRYNPGWHGEYSSEKVSTAAQIKFGAVANFYEQKARLTILANDLSPLLDQLVVNNHPFFTIQPAATTKNGAVCFATPQSTTWLITRDSRQPLYTPVTRKEYLREALMELNNKKNVILADMQQKMPVRMTTVQEAEKKAAIDQLNAQYAGTELQMRMRMFLSNYKTDEEYFKDNADKATADLDRTIHLMDYIASHLSPADLDRPAILSGQAADFQGFEANPSDKMLIRINPGYFNPDLSSESPQFFLLSWQYDPTDAAAADIDRQIREQLDCQKLLPLLMQHKYSLDRPGHHLIDRAGIKDPVY